MKIQEFIKRLTEICPSTEDLKNQGFSSKFIDTIVKGFVLPRKDKAVSSTTNLSDIEKLLTEYDCSFLRFGDYGFLQAVEIQDSRKIFCRSSGTYLSLYKDQIDEFDSDDHSLIYAVAQDQESFFIALLLLQEVSSMRLSGKLLGNDPLVNSYLRRSVEAAGGNKYFQFYKAALKN